MSAKLDLPPSPVTRGNSVRLADTFASADIVRLYREQEGISVERYFEHGDTVYLLECGDTGYRFYYPFTTAGGAEFYRDLARAVEEQGIDYDRDWDEDHQFGFSQIKEGDNVLEVGCNSGKFLKRVSARTENVVGLDFNPAVVEKAAALGVTALNESIEDHADRHAGEYDVVCAFQVFEHLTQINSVVTAMLKALKPGGKLVMSTPNCEPYGQRFNKYEVRNMPPHHLGMWNRASFAKLAEFFDMDFVEHRHYATRGLLPDVYVRSRFMADIRTLPTRPSASDRIKLLAAAPFALALSSYDFLLKGARNHANISVVFRKK